MFENCFLADVCHRAQNEFSVCKAAEGGDVVASLIDNNGNLRDRGDLERQG